MASLESEAESATTQSAPISTIEENPEQTNSTIVKENETSTIEAKVPSEKSKDSRKKKKRHRSPSTSSSDSSSSSSDSSSESSPSPERKKKRKRRKRRSHKSAREENPPLKFFQTQSKEEDTWIIDDPLAAYINENIQSYVPDRNLITNSPVPSNIDKALKLDPAMESFMREKGAPGTAALSKDKSLARIAGKIRDIYGPLTKIWQSVEHTRSGKSTGELLLTEVAEKSQQTVVLIGQAINATNFYRRKASLSAIGSSESKINTWLRETQVGALKNSNGLLFGESYFKNLSKQAKTKNKTVKQLVMPPTFHSKGSHTWKKPFRSSSSPQGGSRGGEHRTQTPSSSNFKNFNRGGSSSTRGRGRGRR